jgi:chromosome segregation ATPase
MKILTAREELQRARDAAWYARVEFRKRVEQQPGEVEDRSARWHQRAEETAAAREAEKDRRRHVVEQQRREERQHEVALAKATGKAAAEANTVIDTDTLLAISTALNALVQRLERVEQQVAALQGEVNGAARRLDSLSAKTRTGGERSSRQVAVLERKLEDQKDLTTDLRSEVRVLRAQVNAVEKKPAEARELHVVHHGG